MTLLSAWKQTHFVMGYPCPFLSVTSRSQSTFKSHSLFVFGHFSQMASSASAFDFTHGLSLWSVPCKNFLSLRHISKLQPHIQQHFPVSDLYEHVSNHKRLSIFTTSQQGSQFGILQRIRYGNVGGSSRHGNFKAANRENNKWTNASITINHLPLSAVKFFCSLEDK